MEKLGRASFMDYGSGVGGEQGKQASKRGTLNISWIFTIVFGGGSQILYLYR